MSLLLCVGLVCWLIDTKTEPVCEGNLELELGTACKNFGKLLYRTINIYQWSRWRGLQCPKFEINDRVGRVYFTFHTVHCKFQSVPMGKEKRTNCSKLLCLKHAWECKYHRPVDGLVWDRGQNILCFAYNPMEWNCVPGFSCKYR